MAAISHSKILDYLYWSYINNNNNLLALNFKFLFSMFPHFQNISFLIEPCFILKKLSITANLDRMC